MEVVKLLLIAIAVFTGGIGIFSNTKSKETGRPTRSAYILFASMAISTILTGLIQQKESEESKLKTEVMQGNLKSIIDTVSRTSNSLLSLLTKTTVIDNELINTRDTAASTLIGVRSSLILSKEIENNLSSQYDRIERINTPLFPMKIQFYLKKVIPIKNVDHEIIDRFANGHFGPDFAEGKILYYYFPEAQSFPGNPEFDQAPYLNVDEQSFDTIKTSNSNLGKMSKLILNSFAPIALMMHFALDTTFLYATVQTFPSPDFSTTVLQASMEQIKLSNVLFAYTLKVYPDSLVIFMKITSSDIKITRANKIKPTSWSELYGGYLLISNPWGNIEQLGLTSINFLCGSQSFEKPFDLTSSGIDRNGKVLLKIQ